MKALRVGVGLAAGALAVRVVAACVGDDPVSTPVIDASVVPPGPNADAAPTPYRELVLQESPIAYWRLRDLADGQLLDERDGAALCVTGTGVTIVNDDVFGPSVHFDGTGGYATLADASALQFPAGRPFTVEAWGRLDNPDSGLYAVATGNMIEGTTIPQSSGYVLFWNSSAGHANGQLLFGDAGGNATSVSTSPFTPARWTHYAVTFDGRQLLLYVDGSPQPASTTTTAFVKGTSTFTVGRDPRLKNPTPNLWIGNLAEIAIYAQVLSTPTILSHATALARP